MSWPNSVFQISANIDKTVSGDAATPLNAATMNQYLTGIQETAGILTGLGVTSASTKAPSATWSTSAVQATSAAIATSAFISIDETATSATIATSADIATELPSGSRVASALWAVSASYIPGSSLSATWSASAVALSAVTDATRIDPHLSAVSTHGWTYTWPPEVTGAALNDATYDFSPRFFKMQSGKLMIIYRQALAHGGWTGKGTVKTSWDGGNNWSSGITLWDETTTASGVNWNNPGGGVTPNGRVIVFYGRNMSAAAAWGFVNLDTGYRYSDDEGLTWSERTTIAFPAEVSGFVPYGNLLSVASGDILQGAYATPLPYTAATTLGYTYVTRSGDNGATWQTPTLVLSGNGGSGSVSEASYAYLGGGNIVGLVRRDQNSGVYYSQVKSTDNGRTWTNQGFVTFDTWTRPAPPTLHIIQGSTGERMVACYYMDRTEGVLRVVLGQPELLLASGDAGWVTQSRKNIWIGTADTDSGYQDVIIPEGGRRAYGVYVNEISSTNTALQFFADEIVSMGLNAPLSVHGPSYSLLQLNRYRPSGQSVWELGISNDFYIGPSGGAAFQLAIQSGAPHYAFTIARDGGIITQTVTAGAARLSGSVSAIGNLFVSGMISGQMSGAALSANWSTSALVANTLSGNIAPSAVISTSAATWTPSALVANTLSGGTAASANWATTANTAQTVDSLSALAFAQTGAANTFSVGQAVLSYTTTPLNLNIYPYTAGTSLWAACYSTPTGNSSTNSFGIQGTARTNANYNFTGTIKGSWFSAYHARTGVASNLEAMALTVGCTSSGNVTSGTIFHGVWMMSSTGYVVNPAGIIIDPMPVGYGAGGITYGIRLGALQGDTRWAISQEGTADTNYLAGSTSLIGTTTMSGNARAIAASAATLDVSGTTTMRSNVSAIGTTALSGSVGFCGIAPKAQSSVIALTDGDVGNLSAAVNKLIGLVTGFGFAATA